MLQALKPILSILPEVKKPEKAPGLQGKLMWTLVALLLFFIMGHVYPIGADATQISSVFERLEILLGSKTGTLLTMGIGPIVLASIFLQLAAGAKLINLDLSVPENKKLFQGAQKLLAIVLAVVEGSVFAFSGTIPADMNALVFGSLFLTRMAIALQIALGSIILLFLDEVVQKYGIGSGVSLFIAAGVSQAIFLGAFAFTTSTGAPAGLVPQALYALGSGDVVNAFWTLVPIIFTILVFLIVVYAEGMKIELPLAYGKARGLGANYPIKFLYVSNMPVILASAVLLNVQLMGLFMANAGFGFLGTYVDGQAVDGVAYYLGALPSPLLITGGYPAYLQFIMQPRELMHIFVYGIVLLILCVIFGWFWIETTGMGSKQVAAQLERTGLQIPGFRQDPRIMEKILDRYIPIITVLGSLFVGILAWFADITGALGTGTGILLTVGILYRFYEDLAKQQLFDMYPSLKNIVS